jgi:hypothetical protein
MTERDVSRAMVAFAIATARNQGIEAAARLVKPRSGELAAAIRELKSTPESHLAEVKVHVGKIAGLLPPTRMGRAR